MNKSPMGAVMYDWWSVTCSHRLSFVWDITIEHENDIIISIFY